MPNRGDELSELAEKLLTEAFKPAPGVEYTLILNDSLTGEGGMATSLETSNLAVALIQALKSLGAKEVGVTVKLIPIPNPGEGFDA